MNNMPNQPLAPLACELAALLLVVEECELDPVTSVNLISLARRISDNLAAGMVEQDSAEVRHA